MKNLVIGDIHGCYTELLELLDKAGLSAEDQIIGIGDIVDRGPDSRHVLEFFNTRANARSIIGNHERKHVRWLRGEVRPALSQQITRYQLGERYPEWVTYMTTFPYFLELPEAILVHGFFEPHVTLRQQKETVLAGTLSGEYYLKKQYRKPWYELYPGQKPLIVGHHDYLSTGEPLVYQDRVFCLDTGCCHGGRLTGLILPDFTLVSVPSRKNYWTEEKTRHVELRIATAREESLTWKEIENFLSSAANQSNMSSAVRERISRLEALFDEAEDTLAQLFNSIQQENKRVLTQLRSECNFDELPVRKQGSIYATRIGETPLAKFLHLARKGELTMERLRQCFKRPSDLIAFTRRIG